MRTNLTKYLLFGIILFQLGCASYPISRKAHRQLDNLIEGSPLFSSSFTGFALYDPTTDRMLYQHQADKYFTPASNTKIYTFYTALEVLGDSLPLLHYQKLGDSLLIWGTGNPIFLHPDFPEDGITLNFLRAQDQPLLYTDQTFQDDRFGAGWMWDDYPFSYQPEKSPMPIYGNLVYFKPNPLGIGIRAYPDYFQAFTHYDSTLNNEYARVRRREFDNWFNYNAQAANSPTLERLRPFHYSTDLLAQLLSDTTGVNIHSSTQKPDTLQPIFTLYRPFPDTLYQQLMKDSDNFIAEQLLLMCSDKLFGFQQTEKAIQFAQNHLFTDAPDDLLWYDGSGLTRYNLFTPRTTVYVLQQLYQTVPWPRLSGILAAGGQSGTIQSWYPGPDGKPYIFAKTGTLRNNHALSGYLITQSGKTLIFSFMHNNFPSDSSPYKLEMQKVLEWIRSEF